jgi:hypothetical protein
MVNFIIRPVAKASSNFLEIKSNMKGESMKARLRVRGKFKVQMGSIHSKAS